MDMCYNVAMLDFQPNYKIARFGLHYFEEPPISGNRGSGTVFFSGCMLKCKFCQNYQISAENRGIVVSEDTLLDVMLHLQAQGAHNVNLVTPSHYVKCLPHTLEKAKKILDIPILYNTSSYESVQDLSDLEGLVDIYLPDLKYFDDGLAKDYSRAPHYFDRATAAIEEMRRQQPQQVFDGEGLMKKGLIVRHLVLPDCLEDTKKVLDYLSRLDKDIYVSLMGQYFPTANVTEPPLNRRLSKREYLSACEYLANVGLHNGWTQELSSATEEYVPDFDLHLLQKQLDELQLR